MSRLVVNSCKLLMLMMLAMSFTTVNVKAAEAMTEAGVQPTDQISKPNPRVLTGKVVDESGAPLPGVTVMLKGSKTGASTDVNGDFALSIKGERAPYSVVFTFIGMERKDVHVANADKPITVTMIESAVQMDEVVVTGYATTTKRNVAGSVAVLSAEHFENKVPVSVDNLLQGQIAGVAVSNVGAPGGTSKIRIRGTNTLSGDAEPLWVVDGVPLQDDLPELTSSQIKAGDMNEIFVRGISGINPNDIESVTVLKDASAAAIYGSRAAGGVIVVTTKQGKAGRMRVNYSAQFTSELKPQRNAGLMNSAQKLAWEQELWDEFSADRFASNAAHIPVVGMVGMIRSGKVAKDGSLWTQDGFVPMTEAEQDAYISDLASQSTDWYDEIFRNSFSMNHHMSLSGGTRNYTYYASLGYTDKSGLLRNNGYKRYNLNLNMTMKPSSKVDMRLGVKVAREESKAPASTVDPFQYAYFANPYERPFNEDGSYRADLTYFNLPDINDDADIDAEKLPVNGFNILREMDETSSKNTKTTLSGNFNISYRPIEQITLSGLVSYTRDNNDIDLYKGKDSYAAFTDRIFFDKSNIDWTPYGSYTQTSSNGDSYNARAQAAYSDTFRDVHRVNVFAGAEIRGNNTKRFYTKQYGYDPNTNMSVFPINPNPSAGDANSYKELIENLSGQARRDNRYASFYCSADYLLMDRYLVNASFRTDGSNNFGSKEQFNPVWSGGLGWHIDREAFMQSLQPVVNRLSLRVSGGYTGNVVAGIYKNLVLSYSSNTWNGFYRGSIATAPNPHLRWEKTRDMKASLDFALFNYRLTGLVEAYYRKSTDVITTSALTYTTGFQSQRYNSSDIVNKGFELSLRGIIIDSRDFELSVGGNIAWNTNYLSSYRSSNGAGTGSNYEGYPLESIFSGKCIGIDPYTGIYLYQLRPDAIINTADDMKDVDNYRYYLGTSIAPVTGGLNFKVRYRNLSLNVGGIFSLGAKISNMINSPVGYDKVYWWGPETPQTAYSDLYRNHLNVTSDMTNRWTPTNTTGVKYPRIVDYMGESLGLTSYLPGYTESSIVGGAFLEKVSYFKINDITLNYNVPEKALRKCRLSSLGVSFTMNNFFTFTNYSGIDPENPGATYPTSRSISVGLNVGF